MGLFWLRNRFPENHSEAGKNRRNFLKWCLGFLGLSLISDFNSEISIAETQPKKELELISENDPLAKSLKYKHDANAVPASIRVKKFGVEGKEQTCKNCLYYTKKGEVKGEEVGRCNFIVGKYVKVGGWCTSWMKKA